MRCKPASGTPCGIRPRRPRWQAECWPLDRAGPAFRGSGTRYGGGAGWYAGTDVLPDLFLELGVSEIRGAHSRQAENDAGGCIDRHTAAHQVGKNGERPGDARRSVGCTKLSKVWARSPYPERADARHQRLFLRLSTQRIPGNR
jgi:hypothetical protein